MLCLRVHAGKHCSSCSQDIFSHKIHILLFFILILFFKLFLKYYFYFFNWRIIALHACMHAQSLQLRLTLFNPLDCSPPGSSVHGILQASVLEWAMLWGTFLIWWSNPRLSASHALQADSLPTELPRKPNNCFVILYSFCYKTMWICYKYTYMSSLSNLPLVHPLPHPTPLNHHRALSWAPCILFYIFQLLFFVDMDQFQKFNLEPRT